MSTLFLWLLDTDKRNLYVLAAVRAGYSKSNWLLHYPFGNGGNNRVNIIKTLVKHIQTLLNMLNIERCLLV